MPVISSKFKFLLILESGNKDDYDQVLFNSREDFMGVRDELHSLGYIDKKLDFADAFDKNLGCYRIILNKELGESAFNDITEDVDGSKRGMQKFSLKMAALDINVSVLKGGPQDDRSVKEFITTMADLHKIQKDIWNKE